MASAWKAGAGTPNPSSALDSAFPRMNGGHSSLFPIAEDSASLATPPTPSGVDTGQKPPPAGTQVPPIRDPFSNSSAGSPSSLRAHEPPLRTSTASVDQAIPTLSAESVVTPQPPVRCSRGICPPTAASVGSPRTFKFQYCLPFCVLLYRVVLCVVLVMLLLLRAAFFA